MDATIISTQALPRPIRERIRAPRVSIIDQDGAVILLPVEERGGSPTKLFGMFVGSGLSSEEFSRQKRVEKGIE